MRSKRSFFVLLRRYLKQFMIHYQIGQRSSTTRYSFISQSQRYRLSQINYHMKYRFILSYSRIPRVPFSEVRNWYRIQGVDVCSYYYHQKQQNTHMQLLPNFQRMKLLRFIVYQFRKSMDRTSSRQMSLRAKTTSAPFMWMQVQFARHSCLKAQSFYQMPRIQVLEAVTFQMVFSSSRQRRQMVWISLISMDSLERLRSKARGWPCSKCWQGRFQNFWQKSSSYLAQVSICLVRAVYSSPNFSCSDFLQMSGLWTMMSSCWLIFLPALRYVSLPSLSISNLLEMYSPKTGLGDWKISIQSKTPLQLAMYLVYLSCASSASDCEPIMWMEEMTLGISLVSSSSRQLSLRQSPLMQVRSRLMEVSAQRRADWNSLIQQRHCDALAQKTALYLFLSGSKDTPSPISYINNAYSQFFSRNRQLPSFLMTSGCLLASLICFLISMFSGRVSTNCKEVQKVCMLLYGFFIFKVVRKEYSWLHFLAASLLQKTMARMAFLWVLSGFISSMVRQMSTWLYCMTLSNCRERQHRWLPPRKRCSRQMFWYCTPSSCSGATFCALNSRYLA